MATGIYLYKSFYPYFDANARVLLLRICWRALQELLKRASSSTSLSRSFLPVDARWPCGKLRRSCLLERFHALRRDLFTYTLVSFASLPAAAMIFFTRMLH